MKCKNDPQSYYSGKEPSPKGLGYCAHAEKAMKIRKGRDGKMWIVKQVGKSKRWVKHDDSRERLRKKLEPWWRKLAEGALTIVYKDGKYKTYVTKKKSTMAIVNDYKKKHQEFADDKNVVAIIWSPRSYDSLYYFVERMPKDRVDKLLKSNDPLKKIMKDRRKYFNKLKIVSKKDEVLKH